MKKSLKENLLNIKRRTISKDELEKLTPSATSYESFAEEVLTLEKANILEMVKAQGRSTRTPSLANQYRINKHALNQTYHKQLQTYRMKFNNAINLDAYFTLDSAIFQQDLPYLEKMNRYIKINDLPREKVPAPERSFALFGDEKIIEEKGKKILSRVGLWEEMKIFPVTDPLRFAVNPARVADAQQFHLIVENKTTFQALLPVLCQSSCATLIYGEGYKITKSIENFFAQYPVNAANIFLYFGDIDRSGIDIWYRLHEKKEPAIPALPFYEACLLKEQAFGKVNQIKKDEAIQHFLSFFPRSLGETIASLLEDGGYYPQEVLKTKELQQILTETDWTSYIKK